MSGARSVAAGARAESRALRFLQAQGLELLTRNYRCKAGELDLVMREADTLVIAEIRYRRNNMFGTPAESVDWRKQRRLAAAALHFLTTHPACAQAPVRFDVLAMGERDQIEWIRDAFRPEQ